MSTLVAVDNAYRVQPLTIPYECAYESYVQNHPAGMLCYSLLWRDVVKETTRAEPVYLLCLKDTDVVGVMPAFRQATDKGSILNALPFYGFHGEPLVSPDHLDGHNILLRAFHELAVRRNCRSATVISNPLIGDTSWMPVPDKSNAFDHRTGQILRLPDDNSDDTIMSLFEGRTRTAIRKAIKEGLSVVIQDDPSSLDRVRGLHESNAAELGIPAKPPQFFAAVRNHMRLNEDYEVLTAQLGVIEVAHLLLFTYGTQVEYFMPAVDSTFRSLQPLSLLVFEAIKQSATNGYRYFNFGGTAAGQTGVYNFKKSWGAIDLPYTYWTRIYDQTLRSSSRDSLLGDYPFFYAIPFSELQQ